MYSHRLKHLERFKGAVPTPISANMVSVAGCAAESHTKVTQQATNTGEPAAIRTVPPTQPSAETFRTREVTYFPEKGSEKEWDDLLPGCIVYQGKPGAQGAQAQERHPFGWFLVSYT